MKNNTKKSRSRSFTLSAAELARVRGGFGGEDLGLIGGLIDPLLSFTPTRLDSRDAGQAAGAG